MLGVSVSTYLGFKCVLQTSGNPCPVKATKDVGNDNSGCNGSNFHNRMLPSCPMLF
jgi:hypothetical protein